MVEILQFPEGNEINGKPNKCCKNCRHFCPYIYEFDEDQRGDFVCTDYGECRRYPPKICPPEESGFPIVENNNWCGEFDI